MLSKRAWKWLSGSVILAGIGFAGASWGEQARIRIVDEAENPLRDTSLVFDGSEIFTDSEGWANVPAGKHVLVKRPGYSRTWFYSGSGETIRLKNTPIRALYLSIDGFESAKLREPVLTEIRGSKVLNALVLETKSDDGDILFRANCDYFPRDPENCELAKLASRRAAYTHEGLKGLIDQLHRDKIYVIARLATFKDNKFEQIDPARGARDSMSGALWRTRSKPLKNGKEILGSPWLDPTNRANWNYAIGIAKEAAEIGFDEIQFDYVRFPTDGLISNARYSDDGFADSIVRGSKARTYDRRVGAISGFLTEARKELGPMGVFVGADIYGYISVQTDDNNIGQHAEDLVRDTRLDYICPMDYPSHYSYGLNVKGLSGKKPTLYPYDVVQASVEILQKRIEKTGSITVQRPWLQDFRNFRGQAKFVRPDDVLSQIHGNAAGGGKGFMMWNAAARYSECAYIDCPKSQIQAEENVSR